VVDLLFVLRILCLQGLRLGPPQTVIVFLIFSQQFLSPFLQQCIQIMPILILQVNQVLSCLHDLRHCEITFLADLVWSRQVIVLLRVMQFWFNFLYLWVLYCLGVEGVNHWRSHVVRMLILVGQRRDRGQLQIVWSGVCEVNLNCFVLELFLKMNSIFGNYHLLFVRKRNRKP
jgi:hypothetical protein